MTSSRRAGRSDILLSPPKLARALLPHVPRLPGAEQERGSAQGGAPNPGRRGPGLNQAQNGYKEHRQRHHAGDAPGSKPIEPEHDPLLFFEAQLRGTHDRNPFSTRHSTRLARS